MFSMIIELAIKILEFIGLKKKVEQQQIHIEQQDNVITVHEAISDINVHDQNIDNKINDKLDDVNNKLDGKTENEQAEILSGEINDYFKMPISYIKDKHELKKNISTDLELINTIDSSCNSIYSFCFNHKSFIFSKKDSERN